MWIENKIKIKDNGKNSSLRLFLWRMCKCCVIGCVDDINILHKRDRIRIQRFPHREKYVSCMSSHGEKRIEKNEEKNTHKRLNIQRSLRVSCDDR